MLNRKIEINKKDVAGIGLAAILIGFCCSLHIIIAIGGFAVLYGFVENNLIILAAAGVALVLLISFYLKKRGKTCCNAEIQKEKVERY